MWGGPSVWVTRALIKGFDREATWSIWQQKGGFNAEEQKAKNRVERESGDRNCACRMKA